MKWPTSSNGRMCGVNPNLVGEMTLGQGGMHGPVHHKSCHHKSRMLPALGGVPATAPSEQRAARGDLIIGGHGYPFCLLVRVAGAALYILRLLPPAGT
jgi:hypothetical protein